MTKFRPEPRDIQIIWHALGLDYSVKPHRKHFVAPSEGEDRVRCEAMASIGLMTKFGVPDRNGMQCFHVTAAGAATVGSEL